MPPPIFEGNCNYTPISTIGTQTVAGQLLPGSQPGVYYGGIFIQNGTSFTYTAYDIYATVTGTGTVTSTVQLTATQTASGPGQIIQPGMAGLGVRYRGALVVVTTGTAGQANSLWD